MELSPPPPIILPSITAAAPPPASLAEMHPDLADYCAELEAWAKSNQRDALLDGVRYFALKGPAVASSGLAAVFSVKHWTDLATWLAAMAGVCVLIDAINPSGQLRNTPSAPYISCAS